MSVSSARLVGVGVFVLAGLALFTVALFMIGDRQMAFARKFTVYTQFTKITGIAPGTIVRVSGARAGSVKEVVPPAKPSDKFRVKLEITETLHAIVRTDSIASIETEGLVGGSFLSVGTGSDQAPQAPENATLPSREPFEIADLMQQMAGTITKVNTAIDELKGEVEQALVSVTDTVDSANDLINDVSDDIKTIASAGARITSDAALIAEGIRKGQGTIGKLVTDDELHRRANSIATHVDGIAANAQQVVEQAKHVVEQAREAIDRLKATDGPIEGITSNLQQTLDDARAAMSGFADNMEALKRNFLFRGFFRGRGYFDLADISPEAYRQGALTKDGKRRPVRVWLDAGVLFEGVAGGQNVERLSEEGRKRLNAAISPYLDHLAGTVLMVEGYAQQGTHDEQYLRSRARAAIVREYLIGTFHLDSDATGLIPLASDSTGSPGEAPWDGVALAVFLEKGALAKTKAVAR